MKTVDIKGKAYVEVNERIKHFREHFKDWSLETEVVDMNEEFCVLKAIVKDPNNRVIATGFAREKNGDSFINKTSYVENCETSAWGRALGNLGIGIDTSIATVDEIKNAEEQRKHPLGEPHTLHDDASIEEHVFKMQEAVDKAKTVEELEEVTKGDIFQSQAKYLKKHSVKHLNGVMSYVTGRKSELGA